MLLRGLCVLVLLAGAPAQTANLALTGDPYLAGGLFTNPVLPEEGQPVAITVRATADGLDAEPIPARVIIQNAAGRAHYTGALALKPVEAGFETTFCWHAPGNGLYRVRAMLDPDNAMAETDESDNATEILLPIIAAGPNSVLHFPWYRETPFARWTTCVTSVKGDADKARLAERGVVPLNWEYGGMSWSYYDKERAETEPGAVLEEIEALFYEKFARDGVHGFGIDEVGGYPGSFKLRASIASLDGLVRARREKPDRFFAVWNAGGLRPEIGARARQGANLLLLETYLWRALPDELGTEDVLAALRARVAPYIRNTDLFQPAYGNACYTLLALDTSERPDRIDLGELEHLVRYIRREFPEMRGIAWYNGGYGSSFTGLEVTPKTDRKHDAVRRKADELCLRYFIMPCVTLMQGALWLDKREGRPVLTAAVSNIGAIDSGPVEVEFRAGGTPLGTRRIERVPAGSGRNRDRALVRYPVPHGAGPHEFAAVITRAGGATILDARATLFRHMP